MRAFLLLLALIASVFSAASASASGVGKPIPVRYCENTRDYLLNVTRAEASVWPPKRGQPITLELAGKLTEAVEGGRYRASVSFNGFPIVKAEGDLCELTKRCPHPAGEARISQTVTIPEELPAGRYGLSLRALALDGRTITCAGLDMEMREGDVEGEVEGEDASVTVDDCDDDEDDDDDGDDDDEDEDALFNVVVSPARSPCIRVTVSENRCA